MISVSSAASATAASRLVLADGRDPENVRFEVAVITYFVDAADLLGVPKSLAAIYGICFASPEPLSAAEIKQRIDISTGSVSQGIRFLTGIGALADVSKPGDRYSRYAPDIELRKLMLHYLERRVETQLDAGRQRIGDVKLAIPQQSHDAAKLLATRVEILEGWHTKSRALLPLMKGALRL
jgi:DNA-binding transcriptional regulator GbsR (MarR family)